MLVDMMICVGVKELVKMNDFAFYFVRDNAELVKGIKKNGRQYCFRFAAKTSNSDRRHERMVLRWLLEDILGREEILYEDLNVQNFSKIIGSSCCINYKPRKINDKKIVHSIEIFKPFNEAEGKQ